MPALHLTTMKNSKTTTTLSKGAVRKHALFRLSNRIFEVSTTLQTHEDMVTKRFEVIVGNTSKTPTQFLLDASGKAEMNNTERRDWLKHDRDVEKLFRTHVQCRGCHRRISVFRPVNGSCILHAWLKHKLCCKKLQGLLRTEFSDRLRQSKKPVEATVPDDHGASLTNKKAIGLNAVNSDSQRTAQMLDHRATQTDLHSSQPTGTEKSNQMGDNTGEEQFVAFVRLMRSHTITKIRVYKPKNSRGRRHFKVLSGNRIVSLYCFAKQRREKLGVGDRRQALHTDPDVLSSTEDTIECKGCKRSVSIRKDVGCNLRDWLEHKVRCEELQSLLQEEYQRDAPPSTSNVQPSHDASTEEDSQDVMALDLGGTRTNDITTLTEALDRISKIRRNSSQTKRGATLAFEGSPEDGTNSLSQPLTFKFKRRRIDDNSEVTVLVPPLVAIAYPSIIEHLLSQ